MSNPVPREPAVLTRIRPLWSRARDRRWTLLVLMLLLAAIAAGVAGWLSHAAGDNLPSAVLTAGASFAGTVGLLLGISHYARSQ